MLILPYVEPYMDVQPITDVATPCLQGLFFLREKCDFPHLMWMAFFSGKIV
jgi:hypothetical protein